MSSSSLPSLLQRIENRFGLTRGDVTVALFLAGAALVGFAYTQFFRSSDELGGRAALLKLVGRHDSVLAARDAALLGGFAPSASDSDSVARPWEPLSEEELLEEGTSDESSGAGRSKKLTLQDVAPVNINTASPSLLELLPGVGEKTAQKIVEYRQSTPFRAVEEIMNVKGIGPKKFAEMRPYLTVGSIGAPAASPPDDTDDSATTEKE